MKIRHEKLLIADLRLRVGSYRYNPCSKCIIINNNSCNEIGLKCPTCYVHTQNMIRKVCK